MKRSKGVDLTAAIVPFVVGILAACSGESAAPPDNPTPGISSITPGTVDQGTAGITLNIQGSDFVSASVVQVGGSPRPTQFLSKTVLGATLPAADFVTSGTRDISVVNPPPGGGISNTWTLTVRQPTLPVPTVASLSPQFLVAGGARDITVNGTGYFPQSIVVVNTTGRATRYVSPTQLAVTLTDQETSASGSLVFQVFNPAPGGGISNLVSLEVRNPAPILSALSTSQADAGVASLALTVNGSGFVRNSAVRFASAPRPTTYVSSTTLTVTLGEGDLRAAGSFDITVENPAPGGGISSPLTLTLVNGVPQIALLPSQGATAGGSGFSLMVHGSRFVQNSVIRWNGTALPTSYIGADRLSATVANALVASPGVAQITVVNPAPGGGTSISAQFTARSLGPPTSTAKTLPVVAGDLVYDAPSAKLYASVAGTSGPNTNSVIAIDPIAGAITGSVFVGSLPRRIERSDNGQYLYVGLNGASAVRRVDLPALTPGLQWSVGNGLVAGDIEVLPGLPNVVVVSRQNLGSSPPLAGVTVYDDGVARPNSSPGHTGGNRITVLETSTVVYGYNNAHTGFGFYEIVIDASGARHASETGGLISGFYTDIVGANGRVYGTDGSIVDAARRTRIGSFPVASTATAVDPLTGRAFLIVNGAIEVYDLNTFQLLGTMNVPGVSFGHPALLVSRIVRWGVDGLALMDEDEIIIVRSPIVAP